MPNPRIPCSKPLAVFKIDSAFHASELDKISTWNFSEPSGKKWDCLLKLALAMQHLNPIKRDHKVFLLEILEVTRLGTMMVEGMEIVRIATAKSQNATQTMLDSYSHVLALSTS